MIVFLLSLFLTCVDIIFFRTIILSILMLPFIGVEVIYLIATKNNTLEVKNLKKHPFILTSGIAGAVVFIAGFLILGILNGGPDYLGNNIYGVVNNGEIIREITYIEYRLLCIVECGMFGGITVLFSSMACIICKEQLILNSK